MLCQVRLYRGERLGATGRARDSPRSPRHRPAAARRTPRCARRRRRPRRRCGHRCDRHPRRARRRRRPGAAVGPRAGRAPWPRRSRASRPSTRSGTRGRRARPRGNAARAASTAAFASMIESTPRLRPVRTWPIVASVMPRAPASSWRRQSVGAIVVLPCGMISSPRSRHQPAMVATLLRIASSSSTTSGVQNSPSRGRLGQERARRHADGPLRNPLVPRRRAARRPDQPWCACSHTRA